MLVESVARADRGGVAVSSVNHHDEQGFYGHGLVEAVANALTEKTQAALDRV